jgi:Na+/H+ antiporter NhaB
MPEARMDEQDAGEQRVRDAAAALPFVAAILLMPPLVLIFCAPVFLAGFPLVAVYIFTIWALVIIAALLVARGLVAHERAGEGRAGPGKDRTP